MLITEYNVSNGEVIQREMTVEELSQHQADQAEFAAQAAETATKHAARQSLLDKLGITADEAKLLLG